MVNRRFGKEMKSRERKTSGFIYKPRPVALAKQRAERTGGRYDSPFKQGIDMFRPKQGDNRIRILPPTWDNAEHFGYTIWVHPYVGADNSTYLCPLKMMQKRCPICAAAKEARDNGEHDEEKQLQAKEQIACWVIDRDGTDDKLPLLYVMSWTMDRDIMALVFDNRKGSVLHIDHPDEGYDLAIKRTGTGLNTRYFGIQVDRDASPIHQDPDVQEEILEYITENPVPSLLHYYDYDHLQNVIEGTSAAKDEDLDDDDDDKESTKGKVVSLKTERLKEKPRRALIEDEDEDEDEDNRTEEEAEADEAAEVWDDDEPKEKELVAKNGRRAKQVEEEEFDEDTIDDDDDDDKPAPTRKRIVSRKGSAPREQMKSRR